MKKFFIVNIGIIIIALSQHLFLIPSNLAIGGVTGIGIILKNSFPNINIGIVILILNIILLIVGFLFFGKEFTGYTIYASVALSGAIGLLEMMYSARNFFPEDIIINLIFGIFIQAVGMAFIFYEGASTGGTDIIAKIINKFTSIELGKSLLLADFIISIWAGIEFSPKLGMYAFLGVLINGVVIDKIIAGFSTKVECQIISDNYKEIVKYIDVELGRGSTYIKGVGTYSGSDKNIIKVVLSRREYINLRRKMKELDPSAFITVHYVHEVIGEGFGRYNI